MRTAFGFLVVLLVAGALGAEDADEPTRCLAVGDSDLAARKAGLAIQDYRLFLKRFPDHPRADRALYMMGESSRLALEQLGSILRADLLTHFNPKWTEYTAVAQHLAQTYGFYAAISEGDPYWYYDMRAYRELAERFPHSDYADDARFFLAESHPRGATWTLVGHPDFANIISTRIQRYETILHDFPDTNRRSEIEQALAELRPYLPE